MEMLVWSPPNRPVRGALYVIPGLHFQGPYHPRLERLARIAAHAGILVASPALPDFLSMRVRPGATADAMAGFEAFLSHSQMPQVKPGLMSISFGAHPVMGIASSQNHRDRIGGILTFGGYLNWKAPIRFSWNDADGVPFDIRNNPVAFGFLIDYLPNVGRREALLAAWDQYIRLTWVQDEAMSEDQLRALADQASTSLSDAEKRLFLQGCRLEDGALDLLEQALSQAEGMDWLNIGPMLAHLRAPLFAVHAADDVISPLEESEALVQACPPDLAAQLLRTGLYGHSGQKGSGGAGLGSLYREMLTFERMISALVRISTTPIV